MQKLEEKLEALSDEVHELIGYLKAREESIATKEWVALEFKDHYRHCSKGSNSKILAGLVIAVITALASIGWAVAKTL